MSKAKDITELRDALLESFDQLRQDPKRMLQARELANEAGKIISTVKAQMEYSLLKGEEPDIPFMGKTSGKALKPSARLLLN
jgi:hypothetical protein